MQGIGRVSPLQQLLAPPQFIVIPMILRGPDVSFYQDDNATPQKINFVQMRAAGARFVFIRAGQNLWPDPDFPDYWRAAKSAGIPRGTYYLLDSRVTPEEQANWFWDIIKDDLPELDVVVDYEESYGGPYGGWKNLKKFIQVLISKGISASKILIYTGYYYWKAHCPPAGPDLDWFKQFGLWLAWYNPDPSLVSIPAPWTNDDLVYWQYTDNGNGLLYGVESKSIDLNWFNGDEVKFAMRYATVPAPLPTDIHLITHTGVDYYHIRRFNTDCYVHVVDLTKVRLQIVEGFRSVPDAQVKYSSNLAFNGGGWGLQPGNVSAPNEYLIIEGVVRQAVAVDGRPCMEITKDNKIVFHTTQPNFQTSWNVWGFDRMIAQAGIYNTKITNTVADPRTVYGRAVDGKLVILVCEGRSLLQKGLTFPEVWSVMKEFGVTDCGNADGGYSSAAVNDYFNPTLLNPTYTVENRRTQHQILLFADGGTTPPPPPPGGTVKQFQVINPIRPRSLPTMTTSDTAPNIPAGVTFDSDVQQTDAITSSHPMMVHIASGTWSGKWIPLFYNGTEYCREIVSAPPTTPRKVVRAVLEFDDQTTEELFP